MGIKTIVDKKNGEIWSGKPVPQETSFADIVFGIATCGLSEVLDDDTTVRVNGEEHTGREVK